MMQFYAAFLLIVLLIGCATPATPTPAASPPPPTPTADLLPTFAANPLLLKPNQRVDAQVTLLPITPDAPPTVSLSDGEGSLAVFDLLQQNTTSGTPFFTIADETGTPWGMDYLLHALNYQAELWQQPYRLVDGFLTLSTNGRTLAYYLCNEYGGRGQWCDGNRLWLFDLYTGEVHQVDYSASGLIQLFRIQFSEDGQTFTGEGCIRLQNPAYFGTCGEQGVATWNVATREVLVPLAILPTAAP